MKNIPCPSPCAIGECYYWENFMCTMPEKDGDHPRYECDDYYAYTGDDGEEEDE